MARQTALPALAPIGGSRSVAAAYLSLSPATFQALVDQGIMPKPKRAGARLIWDLEDVREAFKAMPAARTGSPAEDHPPRYILNEWDTVFTK